MRYTKKRHGESLRCLIEDMVIRGSRDHIIKTLERYANEYWAASDFGMAHKFWQHAEHWRKENG